MSGAARAVQDREFDLSDRDYSFLSELVYERTGIVLGDHKREMVYGRLSRRLRALGIDSFSEYCDLVKGSAGDSEMGFLINAITTNLTRFFRESHHFDHLRDSLVPDLRRQSQETGRRRLRIWSAGCSSGEEPYTIAMVLRDAMTEIDGWDARILATDLDTSMLRIGSEGSYPADVVEGLPQGFGKRFFTRTTSDGSVRYTAQESIRRLISFKQLNFQAKWPMKGPFDAIFCRNVMIYFDNPTKSRMIEQFAELLPPGGYLYVGHAESLRSDAAMFEPVGKSTYRKKSR